MPNPKDYSSKDEWMSACMSKVEGDEGKPHDQAVAQCLSMWERKNESFKEFIDNYLSEE